VSHNKVALSNHALDLDVQSRSLARETADERDERLWTIRGLRIVLDVSVTDIPGYRLFRLLVIEGQGVVRNYGLLVSLRVRHDSPPLIPSVLRGCAAPRLLRPPVWRQG
jgi:hypothetical protein